MLKLLSCLLFCVALGHADPITFRTIAGPANFFGGPPIISRGLVAFIGPGGGVWTVPTSGSAATEVLHKTDAIPPDRPAIPYANADFSPFSPPPNDTFLMGYNSQLRLGGGYLGFIATDPNKAGGTSGLGLYSIPTRGGNIVPLASGNYFPFDFQLSDQGQVVFEYGNQVYAVPAAGGPIVTLADNKALATPPLLVANSGNLVQANQYAYPAISGNSVVLVAGNNIAGGSIQTTPLKPAGVFTDVADGRQFDVYTFWEPKIDGGTVVFGAQNRNSNVQGIYARTGSGPLVTLVDSTTSISGTNNTFRLGGNGHGPQIAASDGIVVFEARDADGNAGLYQVAETGGPITKVLATGDKLGSDVVMNVDIGPEPLSGGELAMRVALHFDWYLVIADLIPTQQTGTLPGGAVDNPTPLPAGGQPISQVQTDLTAGAPQNFYWFSWPGGWLTADAVTSGTDSNDGYTFQLLSSTGDPIGAAALESSHTFTAVITTKLDAGQYLIGLSCTGQCSTGAATINFDTPVSGIDPNAISSSTQK